MTRMKIVIMLLFMLSATIRLVFNFSQELLPGVNGGYYPVQVRALLTSGHLAFSDMPLLFWLDALVVKILSMTGFSITDELILTVVKAVDGFTLPLLLFPLYSIVGKSGLPALLQTSIYLFALLSFSPLILTSDLQKNALAVVFVTAFLTSLYSNQVRHRRSDIVWSVIFLLLTGLTHFGTFAFGLFFLFLVVVYPFRWKAMLPFAGLAMVSLAMIYLLDVSRFGRMVSFWTVLFEKPALLHGMLSLPDGVIILFSWMMAVFSLLVLRSSGHRLPSGVKGFIIACIFCMLVLPFPLFDGEYFKRLSLFLFIPQVLLVAMLAPVLSRKWQMVAGVVLMAFTVLSVVAVAGHRTEAVMNDKAFADLKNLKTVIPNDGETIVVARHGLEWWLAWVLHTRVSQDKAMDRSATERYKTVIVINQVGGFSSDHHRSPFHEPRVPGHAVLLYSSGYFKVYRIKG